MFLLIIYWIKCITIQSNNSFYVIDELIACYDSDASEVSSYFVFDFRSGML